MSETPKARAAVEDAACYATFFIDRAGVITSWNPAVKMLLGFDEPDFIGRDFAILFTPADREAAEPRNELEAARGGFRTERIRRAVRHDGSQFWSDGVVTPMHDAQGDLVAYAKVIRDRSRQPGGLEPALEYGGVGTFDWDRRKGVATTNRQFRRILGVQSDAAELPDEEWIGKILPADCEKWRDSLRHYDTGGGPFVCHFRVERDGAIIWVYLSAGGPESSRVLGTISDVTAREELLREQARLLKRSNKELEQFASVASHDMSEPLRMINAYLTLLTRKYGPVLDESAHEYIEFAVDGVRRMRELIDMLLEYSRVQRANRPFAAADVDAAIRRASSNLMVTIEEKGAEIRYAGMPTVWGDSVQLVQLFQNLLGNALKYQAPGAKPEIVITAEEIQNGWGFAVKDNGIGVEMEFAESIFEPFRRLHNRQLYPGTGLGLAVCKKIVERHCGKIWVVSTEGEGATFHFTLGKDATPQATAALTAV